MSTYDAYNLSLRDSTEFTVPTGGSGGGSDFSIAHITFDFSSLPEEALDNVPSEFPFIGNFIVKETREYGFDEIDTKSEFIHPSIEIITEATPQTIDVVMYNGVGVMFSTFSLPEESFTVNGSQIYVVPSTYGEYNFIWYITGDATIIVNFSGGGGK